MELTGEQNFFALSRPSALLAPLIPLSILYKNSVTFGLKTWYFAGWSSLEEETEARKEYPPLILNGRSETGDYT